MTHDEMIAVIQAHKEGKKLQYRKIYLLNNPTWKDCDDYPDFNFLAYEYRVKPEEIIPHYRPFKNAKEVMDAIKEHGLVLCCKTCNACHVVISEWGSYEIWIGSLFEGKCYEEAFNEYTFADGTPFGVKEE